MKLLTNRVPEKELEEMKRRMIRPVGVASGELLVARKLTTNHSPLATNHSPPRYNPTSAVVQTAYRGGCCGK